MVSTTRKEEETLQLSKSNKTGYRFGDKLYAACPFYLKTNLAILFFPAA